MAEIRKALAPPAGVVRYFDGKTNAPAFSWLDVWAEEHAYKFTVAKAVELDVLNAFRSTVSTALTTGRGYENWKLDIQKELVKLGWWGPRMISDPEGIDPDRMVNFASDRRLKTIFWSNMNSARAAGQWERAQRSKRVLPYVLYVRTTSADPRPEHLAWVGLILPIDHPFWRTHWPPNGWMCKCQVRMISEREAKTLIGTKRVVGKDEDGNDISIWYTDELPELGPDVAFRNRRTGEITMVPAGIDAGWATNPGLARAETLIQNFEAKLAEADHGDATRVLKELWSDPYLQIATRLPQKVWLPAGHNPALAQHLGAKSPVISITSEAIAERIDRHKMPVDDFATLPDLLSSGEILPDLRGKENTRSIFWRSGKSIWRAFVSVSQNGYMRANSLHQKDERGKKAGGPGGLEMAAGVKRGREGPIPGLYPAPSKGHLGLRTSLPRFSEYKRMGSPAQSYTEHFQHPAGLRFSSTPLRLVHVLRATVIVHIAGIAAVGRKVSAFEDHEPPCASEHFVDPDCAMTSSREAVSHVSLTLVFALNGFAIFLHPDIARILAASGLLAGAAIFKAVQIIRRRRPTGCIRKTAHCGYNCQRQNLPHYPLPHVTMTSTIKRPQTRVKGSHAPSFIHG